MLQGSRSCCVLALATVIGNILHDIQITSCTIISDGLASYSSGGTRPLRRALAIGNILQIISILALPHKYNSTGSYYQTSCGSRSRCAIYVLFRQDYLRCTYWHKAPEQASRTITEL